MKDTKVKVQRSALSVLLSSGIMDVEFVKKDGSLRKMKCTTNINHIPEEKRPTDADGKVINESVMRVYDVEVEGWRSFRVDSVKSFSLG